MPMPKKPSIHLWRGSHGRINICEVAVRADLQEPVNRCLGGQVFKALNDAICFVQFIKGISGGKAKYTHARGSG